MTTKKINGVEVWKQLEDLAVPQLRLSVYERAAYSYLLRHSLAEGNRQLRFSIPWLVRGTNLTIRAARRAVHSLIAKDALRLVELGQEGHLVQVRLPVEIHGVDTSKIAVSNAARTAVAVTLEKADFLVSRALRLAIHEREGSHCFYCLRRLTPVTRCIDHVIPRARKGLNSYRNLVSACAECNSQKAEGRAEDFVRWLYREGRLTAAESSKRLKALEALAAGNLRPRMQGNGGGQETKKKCFAARIAS